MKIYWKCLAECSNERAWKLVDIKWRYDVTELGGILYEGPPGKSYACITSPSASILWFGDRIALDLPTPTIHKFIFQGQK